MRTSLTLDPHVASLVEQHRQISARTLNETINDLLRLGLIAANQPAAKPIVIKPRAMGLPSGMSYDNIGELLEILDRVEGK